MITSAMAPPRSLRPSTSPPAKSSDTVTVGIVIRSSCASLNTIDEQVPSHLDIHLVLDNYGSHKTPKVAAWFRRRPRYHLRFTPTSASWLNQVERWFAKITEQRIRRDTFRSVPQLIEAIMKYIQAHNRNPKPFVWTASAETIFQKLKKTF
jgi:transposase